MRFYGMSYRDVLALPIRAFWSLARNISRVRAEEDRRMFVMLNSAFGNGEKYLERLDEERGVVAVGSRDDSGGLDRAGMERIRGFMSRA